ncbi:MAG TPA: hypothetical protein VH419_07870 [Nocardioidaceae bacterium]|jgi:hypothetical protein
MSYYAMDTDVVQNTGRKVFDLGPEADSAVQGVLNAYMDASSAVHHPLVSQAMSSYHDSHQKAHRAFPQAVRAVGSNTASGGRAIADGQNESTSVQHANALQQQSLARDLNHHLG